MPTRNLSGTAHRLGLSCFGNGRIKAGLRLGSNQHHHVIEGRNALSSQNGFPLDLIDPPFVRPPVLGSPLGRGIVSKPICRLGVSFDHLIGATDQ
jgi:hypothetical protein